MASGYQRKPRGKEKSSAGLPTPSLPKARQSFCTDAPIAVQLQRIPKQLPKFIPSPHAPFSCCRLQGGSTS